MNRLKLIIAFMSFGAISIHASEEKKTPDSSVRARTRVLSNEIKKRLQEKPTPRTEFSEEIRKLQSSSMLRNFINSVSFRSDPRYTPAREFSSFLAEQKNILDSKDEAIDEERLSSIVAVVSDTLVSYQEHSDKVTVVVSSDEFKKLTKFCREIIDKK